jgi:transcriptional antiterminator NusG
LVEKTAVQQGLKERIFQLLIPTEDVVELRRNKKQVKKRKFFPGYVLVDMDVDNQTYWMIRKHRGCDGLFGWGESHLSTGIGN